ncbi:hypothetical protein GCM10020295_29820 [Streptomyces cinereospinus]
MVITWGAEGTDLAHQLAGRLVHVLQGEAALRQRRQRVALGQAGVDEAEPLLLDAEDLARLVHLTPAHLVNVLLDVRVALELGVEDGAALPARAGHDQHVHPLGHVLRHGGRALARLVVGVRVDGHQSQLVSQDSILVWSAPGVTGCERRLL